MAHILISSNRLNLAEQWVARLSNEHQTALFSGLKKIVTHTIPADAGLIIIDAALLDSDFSVLAPLIQQQLKILIIGDDWNDDRQIEALAFGCSGYCEMQNTDKLLLKAVNQLLAGDTWIQRHQVPRLIKALAELNGNVRKNQPVQTGDIIKKLSSLSSRERDVANLIKIGESNKAIAAALNISERTVKAHLTSIFNKLEIPDRLHLALFLKETGSPD